MSADRAIDFGTKLREARERRGVSLRAIAEATKISVAVLEALERNDVSRLPGGIFSRAFIRSYAVEVGLDPDATIQEFVAQFPHDAVQTGHEAPLTATHAPLGGERHLSRTFMQLVGVGLPVAAAVLYFGIGMQRASRSVDSPPSTPVVESAPPGEPPPPTPGAAPTSVLPAPPTSSVPPPAPPAAGAPAAPAGAPTPDAVPDDVVNIVLSARRKCYVSATVDGRKAIEQSLTENDHRTLEVHKEMVLTVGDAAAIVMTLNGAPARAIGKSGEVVTVRVSPSNFKEYLQAR